MLDRGYPSINPYVAYELHTQETVDWRKAFDVRKIIEDAFNEKFENVVLGKINNTSRVDDLPLVLCRFVQGRHRQGCIPNIHPHVTASPQSPFFNTYHQSSVDLVQRTVTFKDDDIEAVDAIQGILPDCFLIATISSLEWTYPTYCTQFRAGLDPGQGGGEEKVWMQPPNGGKIEVSTLEYVIDSVWTTTSNPPFQIFDKDGVPKHSIMIIKQSLPFTHSRETDERWPELVEKVVLSNLLGKNMDNGKDWDQVKGDTPSLALERLCGPQWVSEGLSSDPSKPLGQLPVVNPYQTPADQVWDFIKQRCFQINLNSLLWPSEKIAKLERQVSERWGRKFGIVRPHTLKDHDLGAGVDLQMNTKLPMVAGTVPVRTNPDGTYPPDPPANADINLPAGHVFSVFGLIQIVGHGNYFHPRTDYVVLRNPWGHTEPRSAIRDLRLAIAFRTIHGRDDGTEDPWLDDGLFAITMDTFLTFFHQIWTIKWSGPGESDFVPEETRNQSELLLFEERRP